ncbi:hypothetical protein ALC57_08530 [Trachymyrmex cornetzi]|uniref:Uncharacterized protein n=1 Tax=Trachymyrmex cornetzi TaxID=471704 RepID=A0A195E2R2_9HYME|nr:hypothetical protein ALC57_08530 [Trachymyrmex cornetzi]
MSRRGPVLETRREDFANDKGSDKEASWSRTRKAFLVRVVQKSTSRVGREITELANERTGDSTANTWTDRESFLRATTTSEVLTSIKFSLCDEMESLLSESTSTKINNKLVDNDREMNALTRVIQFLFERPTRVEFCNSLCNRYVVVAKPREHAPRNATLSLTLRLALWIQRSPLNSQCDFLNHNAKMKKEVLGVEGKGRFGNPRNFADRVHSCNITTFSLLINNRYSVAAAEQLSLGGTLENKNNPAQRDMCEEEKERENNSNPLLDVVYRRNMRIPTNRPCRFMNVMVKAGRKNIVHAKANSVFKREAIVGDTMSLMAAVYARGHERQGSPASYVTLNTSTG